MGYHGKLVFPVEFPFKPPSIYMITPNGRFKTDTRLCLSISDYHPDTWNPAWSVATILTGLLSFMLEKNPTLGSIETWCHLNIRHSVTMTFLQGVRTSRRISTTARLSGL